jgi:hypothetical protein
MAGLVPAIQVFRLSQRKTWIIGTRAAKSARLRLAGRRGPVMTWKKGHDENSVRLELM